MHEVADAVVELVASRPPTLGAGRLVCIDGPAGSGKSTLAAAVQAAAASATLVHLDDLYEGWDGLPRVGHQLASLLSPMIEGHAGRYRRWDWEESRWAETVTVAPGPLLVLEGVGAGSGAATELATVLVWVETAHDLRMRRGLARDGDAFAPHWERWARGEATHFAAHRTRVRADLVVDGETGSVSVDQRP